MISCSGSPKLFAAHPFCEKERGGDLATFGGEQVAMRVRELAQESVCTQQAQLPAYAAACSTVLFVPARRLRVEDALEIPVTQPLDQELTPRDGFEQGSVGVREWAQRSYGQAFPGNRAGDLLGETPQRGRGVDTGQGVEVALVDRLADLSAPVQIGDPSSQLAPRTTTVRVALFGPEDLEVRRIVEGVLGPQHAALFVVELEGVLANAVLETDPFFAFLEVAADFTREVPAHSPAEKAQHICTAKARDPMQHQGRIDLGQRLGAFKHDVGRPLALVIRPVVGGVPLSKDPGMCRGQRSCDLVQDLGPIDPELAVHELLRPPKVLDSGEAVIPLFVGDCSLVHLARQPLATVEADL